MLPSVLTVTFVDIKIMKSSSLFTRLLPIQLIHFPLHLPNYLLLLLLLLRLLLFLQKALLRVDLSPEHPWSRRSWLYLPLSCMSSQNLSFSTFHAFSHSLHQSPSLCPSPYHSSVILLLSVAGWAVFKRVFIPKITHSPAEYKTEEVAELLEGGGGLEDDSDSSFEV